MSTVAERPNSGKPETVGDRMLWANGLRFLHPNERAILVALAYHDGPGGAFPSAELIATETGISRSAVWKAIAGLIDQGMVARKRRQTSNIYILSYGSTVPANRTVEPNSHRPSDRDSHRPSDRDGGRPDDRDGNRKEGKERDRGGREAPATRPTAPVPHQERESAREGAGAASDGLATCVSPTAATPSEPGNTEAATEAEEARQHADLVREARMTVLAELPPDDWSDQ